MSRLSSANLPTVSTKNDLHKRLIAGIDLAALGRLTEDELRLRGPPRRRGTVPAQLRPARLGERERLVTEVLDETFGLGPLEPLMRTHHQRHPDQRPHQSTSSATAGWSPRSRLQRRPAPAEIVQRIVGRVGRRVDETSPMVDARLPDGSRVNAIIPPLALDGRLVSIRRFGRQPLLVDDLVAKKADDAGDGPRFLAACVEARINMLISGGTGSGKTTLLNALSAFIPDDERVATIEDAAELRLAAAARGAAWKPGRPTSRARARSRPATWCSNALRMRPDRIIVGECRGPEALDMLQAMNTGHDGSLTTIHANDTRDAIGRLEMMVGMAGFDLPIWIIRRQIASAIQIVVQVARLPAAVRKIVKISEITGMEGDVISMHDLFVFKQTGVDAAAVAQGYFGDRHPAEMPGATRAAARAGPDRCSSGDAGSL